MTLSSMTPSNRIALRTAKISALSVAMLLMQSNTALAAPNPLLQIIENTANASYVVNNGTNFNLSSTSNQVSVQSSAFPQYGISLTSPPRKTISPGSTASWKNVLTNTSYSDQTIDLTLTVPKSLSDVKLYQDLNNNGRFDEGVDKEIKLDDNLTAQITLGKSESIELTIQALSDANATADDTADIKLGAVVVEDPSISALVTDELIIVESRLDFMLYSWDGYKSKSQIGENIYLQASCAQCNVQDSVRDEVWITITSSKTGDTYSVKAIETGVNTGKFRVEVLTENNANAINDDIIQTLQDANLVAKLDAYVNENGVKQQITEDLNSTIAIVDEDPSLQVTKEGDVKTASFGDYVNYTINVKNNGAATAYNVELKDALPRGFDYVQGSVNIDKAQTTEFKSDGKYQVLSLGNDRW